MLNPEPYSYLYSNPPRIHTAYTPTPAATSALIGRSRTHPHTLAHGHTYARLCNTLACTCVRAHTHVPKVTAARSDSWWWSFCVNQVNDGIAHTATEAGDRTGGATGAGAAMSATLVDLTADEGSTPTTSIITTHSKSTTHAAVTVR